LRRRGLSAGGLEEADRRETGEHRDPQERGWLSLREIGCAVDEVAEASLADFLGGVFDIFSGGINAAGDERCIVVKGAGGLAYVSSKALDEIRAAALLLAGLLLQLVRGSGSAALSPMT
jgi:hypothetical protein